MTDSDATPWTERPCGIDLGTTNSAAAMLTPDGQSVLLAEDEHGRAIDPSVVGWDPGTESIVTGWSAWNRRGMSPEPVQSVKRMMGLDRVLELGPHPMTPAEVSAAILGAQIERMRTFTRRSGLAGSGLGALRTERAVITVPAYFDAPQIEATREAGELAGIDVLGLLQEPTAACMYCVWKRGLGDGTFLVYDLGGGTFDVSVIRCLFGEYQVLGIHGDNYLGGDDFDRRLAEHFRLHLVEQGYALDLDVATSPEDALRFLVLTRIARAAKEALSVQPVHYIAQRDLFEDQSGRAVTLELELSRGRWEGLMADLVASTIRCCHRAIELAVEKANVGLTDIDHVLLVGGSTRVPLVQSEVANAFCGDGKTRAQAPIVEAPDSCVALGAAIHAANLGGTRVGLEGQKIALEISSPLATVADRIRVAGRVLGDVEGSSTTAFLKDEVGATLGIESVEDGRFKVTDVPLPSDGRHPVSLELMSDSGAPVAEIPFQLYRSGDVRQTGSALSNPTVLAKDVYLEVQRDGRLERKILVARGSTLPTSERWRFYTADRSGAVILSLLQNRYPISAIHLSVPRDLPVGTPVELELSIDEKMVITAQGGVAGQTFWATVEPPPARELESWAAIEARLDTAEALADKLWGNEARVWRRDAPFLIASIREAARTDPDKLGALVARLDDLLEYLGRSGGELTPSFERFGIVLDSIRRIALREDETLGLDLDAWEARIADLRAQGRDAWDHRDQAAWDRAYSKAQALFETLSQDEHRFVQAGSLEHITSLYNAAQFRHELLKEKLGQVVMPRHADSRKLREEALEAIRATIDSEIATPLERIRAEGVEASPALREELDRVNTLARQLDKQLAQLPSLGVVKSHD